MRTFSTYALSALTNNKKQLRFALIQLYGIGRAKASFICSLLGVSPFIKVNQLTRFQTDELNKIISSNFLIELELKRIVQTDIRRLVTIGCYRGLRHIAGLPLRGQRTHTNAKTARRLQLKLR
uniref:Small ribosomal subunit protein uS13m n=1 Tax=Chaetosphaeridium globosum TaxID=96477 RepID=Q8M1G5_CHAGL|nr:ribosomal protein S13 [Chaetosphaeridium globosum]AAM96621.1 ribosomal protein S13 [Chaetosphaeridium globosum]